MFLRFLPANQAWVFLFGQDVRTATIQDIGGFGRFFNSRKLAVEVAEQCGFKVNAKGEVYL